MVTRPDCYNVSPQVSQELPKSLLEALLKFGTKSPKLPFFTVVDSHGKSSFSLTYGEYHGL